MVVGGVVEVGAPQEDVAGLEGLDGVLQHVVIVAGDDAVEVLARLRVHELRGGPCRVGAVLRCGLGCCMGCGLGCGSGGHVVRLLENEAVDVHGDGRGAGAEHQEHGQATEVAVGREEPGFRRAWET